MTNATIQPEILPRSKLIGLIHQCTDTVDTSVYNEQYIQEQTLPDAVLSSGSS